MTCSFGTLEQLSHESRHHVHSRAHAVSIPLDDRATEPRFELIWMPAQHLLAEQKARRNRSVSVRAIAEKHFANFIRRRERAFPSGPRHVVVRDRRTAVSHRGDATPGATIRPGGHFFCFPVGSQSRVASFTGSSGTGDSRAPLRVLPSRRVQNALCVLVPLPGGALLRARAIGARLPATELLRGVQPVRAIFLVEIRRPVGVVSKRLGIILRERFEKSNVRTLVS